MTGTSKNISIIMFALSSTAGQELGDLSNSIDLRRNQYYEKNNYYSNSSNRSTSGNNIVMDFSESKSPEQEILSFARKIATNTKNLESDFAEIVEKRFWDMI